MEDCVQRNWGGGGLIMLRNLLKQLKFRHFGCFSQKLGVFFYSNSPR